MASMIDQLRAASSAPRPARVVSEEMRKKIQEFAMLGGTTPEEDAHVRRICQTRGASSATGAPAGAAGAQAPRAPAAPWPARASGGAAGAASAQAPWPPAAPAAGAQAPWPPAAPAAGARVPWPPAAQGSAEQTKDRNEPWKTETLLKVLKSVQVGDCADIWTYRKVLSSAANLECGWIGKREFLGALEIEPLAAEVEAAWGGRHLDRDAWSGAAAKPWPAPPLGQTRGPFPDEGGRRAAGAGAPAGSWSAQSSHRQPMPQLPDHPYTVDELASAEALLGEATWPPFESVYDAATVGKFVRMDEKTLCEKARVLSAALRLAKAQGRFGRLAHILEENGQAGMETFVWTDFHRDGNVEPWCEKTAGDALQSYWCRRFLDHMGECFMENRHQAAIAHWLDLGHCLLPVGVANNVESWSEHPYADFQEMAALYLPPNVLNLYMNVFSNAFLIFLQGSANDRTCHFRDSRGRLCCDRHVAQRYGAFCSRAHAMQRQWVALSSFSDAHAYGPEYIVLRKGDLVIGLDTDVPGEGWAYGQSMSSLAVGWFPAAFVEARD